jgi:predicted acyl esterase
MKGFFTLCISIFLIHFTARSQMDIIPIPGVIDLSTTPNGVVDGLADFSTRIQVPFTMPDGIKLMTDVYLPIAGDDIAFDLEYTIPGLNINLDTRIVIIPKGTQYLVYPTLNGQPNPNPYKLPIVLSKTPYNKRGDAEIAGILSLLGYAYLSQDERGRYASEDRYFPLMSQGWSKEPYHPNWSHILDLTPLSDPRNSLHHEDGYNTIEYIKNNLVRKFDLDGDGINETEDLLYTGVIGMFGASALAYNQLQAAAAHKIDRNEPGLKALLPIVGTAEFYRSTGFDNGVLRHQLVWGWINGQMVDTDDDLMDVDFDLFNSLHSSNDYGTADKFEAADLAIDHFTSVSYEGNPPGYFPNSPGRMDMDVSRATVDEHGEGDINGEYSRYSNMDVPTYHVSGWYDIFVGGQYETRNFQERFLPDGSPNKNLQKIIIGPWAHQTITSRRTGDMEYPPNVLEILKADINDFDEFNIQSLAESELVGWYRYNLNRNPIANIGEPIIRIPEATEFQQLYPLLAIRFPTEDFDMEISELLNFLIAKDGLDGLPLEIKIGNLPPFSITLDVPQLGEPLIDFDGTTLGGQLVGIPEMDFETVPNVRYYVIGPDYRGDGTDLNGDVGNIWMAADSFPIADVDYTPLYLHTNGTASFKAPQTDEGYSIFVHDPENPVRSIGGANMIVKTPQGDRDSQGQFNLADERYASYTMDREGVVKYTSEALSEPMTMIGFPKVKLFAKSNPSGDIDGVTDTDFHVRIVDVYPDGREMLVVEGCVNARGRAYARSVAEGAENDDAPFTNIEIGEVYEYYFNMLPIAYAFGREHKIKILVSSSNFPRYQSNPNIPITENQFFRRQPGDGKKHEYNGEIMEPRLAVNRVAVSPEMPSQVLLPLYNSIITSAPNNNLGNDFMLDVYPNPTADNLNLISSKSGNFRVNVLNYMGQKMMSQEFTTQTQLNVKSLASGHYIVEITSLDEKGATISKAFTKL